MSRYDRYGLPVRRWDSVASFRRGSKLLAGIDVIALPSGSIVEMFTSGDVTAPRTATIPVVFTGAIAQRDTIEPPYFGGTNMGRELDIPVISISDPLLSVDPEINLGWYTGTASDGSQQGITDILSALRDVCSSLLLVGGDGGSFAALYYANRIGRNTRVLAWNLETDLLRYNPSFVRKYLCAALRDSAWLEAEFDEDAARVALDAAGIDSRITSFNEAAATLILQDFEDWRATVHAIPFIREAGLERLVDGLHVSTDGRLALGITSHGEGGGAPSIHTLALAIKSMAEGAAPITTFGRLIAEGAMSVNDQESSSGHEIPNWHKHEHEVSCTQLKFLGKNLVLAGFAEDYIFEVVRKTHEPYERRFLEALIEHIEPGDLVVDVGANIGNHAITLASGGKVNVVAFEPQDAVAQVLELNVALNALDKEIKVERAAVGSAPGHARAKRVDWSNVGSTQYELTSTGTRVIRLDDYNFDAPVRLIKIDAEGMDIDVLRGARATIDRYRPFLTCEVGNRREIDALDLLVVELGYTYLAQYNATPTYILAPARSPLEKVRIERLNAVQRTQTLLSTRDLQWQAQVLRDRTERLDALE
ncbi:FkbM family methyltransferase [Janibacter terrae]|uniref:FkbM family methyltransferase n=1 Tax=Janibacter terrae TaxID=103817 RepID=UPI000B17A057|nr:FkbM family methyltransferase [Janibacter terrae]